MNTDKLVIIDGSAMLYRAYYGLRPLTTSKGTPIQAVLGFCKALKKLIREQKPSHMAVAWDMGHSGRSEIHAEYKSTREERPCDLTEQQMNIKKFATAIKLKQLECAGYEADDIIGTVVRNTKSFAKEIIIVTPDKDLRQLVGGNVIVVDPISVKRYDEETCLEKYGFPTSKIRFYHALLGDTSDNIPGVKGIGKKTAQELVTNFENLDDLYANLQKVVKPRTKMLLEEGKEKAYLSYELFGLKEVAVDTDLDSLKFDEDDWKGAYPLFEELEFKSLLPTGILKAKAQKIVDRSWKLSIVKTVDELKNLEGRLANINLYAFDTELDMCSEHHASFAGFSIAFNDSESFFVPVPDSTETVAHGNINLEAAIEFMGRLFSSTEKAVIMHNAKFDMFVLRRLGVEVLSKLEDTLLIAHLLRKDSLSIGLKALSSRVLGEDMHDFEEVIGGYGSFRAVPIEESAAYGAHDALQTFKLFKVLDAELKKIPRLQAVYDDMELPLCKTLLDMEYKGITLDPTKLYAVEKAVDKKREIVRAKLMGAIEEVDPGGSVDLNLNSPRQVEVLLFDVLKLPHVKKSGTGKRSTSHDVLESLCHLHPIPSLMVEHRELAKLKSTYLTPLPEAVNPQTNRIHTNFSQIHVATGRLSSNNPNLQNIPVSGEFGLGVRGAFVAPEGKMFVAADYSQIELRVLAHITKDQSLISAFVNDRDVHIQTAAQIFNIHEQFVTPEQRSIGKRINFSIIYGQTAFGLSKALKIKLSEAKNYIEAYFTQYSAVRPWMEATEKLARENGFVETLMGRRRYIPGLKEKNKHLYEAARRAAINTVIQGTAAEIIKKSMIELNQIIKEKFPESALLLQIHDELVIECPKEDANQLCEIVGTTMRSAVDWEVKLEISTKIGDNWADVTK